ncbi:hypothetical protein TNCV_4572951 [Trichonephila clavipes]|nr:hypothetical protein TNCV_4572951 [Trichonephila clavipes]
MSTENVPAILKTQWECISIVLMAEKQPSLLIPQKAHHTFFSGKEVCSDLFSPSPLIATNKELEYKRLMAGPNSDSFLSRSSETSTLDPKLVGHGHELVE